MVVGAGEPPKVRASFVPALFSLKGGLPHFFDRGQAANRSGPSFPCIPAPTTQAGDSIKAHYSGRLASNGQKFDSSYDRGKPLVFKVGVRQVIQVRASEEESESVPPSRRPLVEFLSHSSSTAARLCQAAVLGGLSIILLPTSQGWDLGILGGEGIPAMRAGGKRVLRIPAGAQSGERIFAGPLGLAFESAPL